MADFKTRQDALDQKAASVLEEYKTLMGDIQKTGTHYGEFRRLKETVFALEKVGRRNGIRPEKAPRIQAPGQRADLFVRKNAPAPKEVAEPKEHRNPFDRAANLAKRQEAEQAANPTPPDLFNRKGRVSEPHPPLPKKKAKKQRDPKRLVLASSEEKDND